MKTKRLISALLALLLLGGSVSCEKDSGELPKETSPYPVGEEHELDAGSDTEGIDISKMDLSSYNSISVADYLDKTAAGHISQYIGFLSGYEFARDASGNILIGMPDDWFEICNGPYAEPNVHNKHVDKLHYNEKKELWEIYNDDDFSIDILNQYIIRNMYEEYGTFCSKSIGNGWVKYNVYDMGGGHRNAGAYGLFNGHGYLSYFAGRAEFGNKYGVNGEPYIANETLGLNCPGMPNTAFELTEVFASVTSDMDPVLWAEFFSVMYSLAYFESDIPTLIAQARKTLPEKCVVQEVIDEVLKIREQFPQQSLWRLAARLIDKSVYREHYGKDSRMGETSINCAFVLLGLLWGEGDWYQTCKIISLAGHGGDSTTPVGLGIVGVISGMDSLDEEALAKTWQDGRGVVINKPIDGTSEGYWMCALGLPKNLYMADTIKLYQQNFEHILEEAGGFRFQNIYYIPREEIQEVQAPLYEDFDGGIGEVKRTGNVSAAAQKDSYMGKSALKLSGEGDAYLEVSGLQVGESYKLSAYVYADRDVTARLYVSDSRGEVKFATVYSTLKYVLREIVFEATEENMRVGISLGQGESGYVITDDLLVARTNEKILTDKISVDAPADGKCTGGFGITVSEKLEREVYLKITFSNISGFLIDGKITVNGKEIGTAPFYRTGDKLYDGNGDAVYIPLLLNSDVNEIEFTYGKTRTLYINEVSVVEK